MFLTTTPEDIEIANFLAMAPAEAWREIYGIMRFAKGWSNIQRFCLAEQARQISPTICTMAYWAAILVNGRNRVWRLGY